MIEKEASARGLIVFLLVIIILSGIVSLVLLLNAIAEPSSSLQEKSIISPTGGEVGLTIISPSIEQAELTADKEVNQNAGNLN